MLAAERARMRRSLPLAEALLVLIVTYALAVGFGLPTLWLLVPLAVLTITRRPFENYGLTWRGAGSVGFHATTIVAVFVPYALGHYAWAHWWMGAAFHLRLPADFPTVVAEQVLLVGLPEEFFFRGYLQTQCDLVWRKRYRLFGARWGAGLVFGALTFALCHVPTGGPGRLVVFFPGLFYGWLRARTNTIAVPTLYHAASNLLMRIMLDSLAT
jgi:membrane protease YdiL (CAAX protease family)